MLEHFDLGLKPPAPHAQDGIFIYAGGRLLAATQADAWQPLTRGEWQKLKLPELSQHYIGTWRDRTCMAHEVPEQTEAPKGYEWIGLRHFIRAPDDALFALAGRGAQLIEWHRTHQYCGQCGQTLSNHVQDRARECIPCAKLFYPRLSPCIIVLVTRGPELLLARGARHPEGLYSTLAGFIEPGESAEHALHREVREEVGIEVTNLRYCGSQPWPFPHQLMLGFHADYLSGEISLHDEEITEAHWWHYRQLPQHPPASTISGRLIQQYLDSISQY